MGYVARTDTLELYVHECRQDLWTVSNRERVARRCAACHLSDAGAQALRQVKVVGAVSVVPRESKTAVFRRFYHHRPTARGGAHSCRSNLLVSSLYACRPHCSLKRGLAKFVSRLSTDRRCARHDPARGPVAPVVWCAVGARDSVAIDFNRSGSSLLRPASRPYQYAHPHQK